MSLLFNKEIENGYFIIEKEIYVETMTILIKKEVFDIISFMYKENVVTHVSGNTSSKTGDPRPFLACIVQDKITKMMYYIINVHL